ncbi:MAG: M1 family aminopeptidase [Candidatus Neomarinimicrobiota bacterium]
MIFSQKKTDQNLICSQTKSSSQVFSETSTLTEDQGKIDITYYKIDFEIDFNNEQILGSVIANGFVGLDQPDYIEFDFSDEMIVDSVWLNNESTSFDHIDDRIKVLAPASIPGGYNFSCQIFYHGSPPTSGFGSYNFDMHNNIDHVWTLSEPYGARDWWPCKDDPSDKADSLDIIVTVPSEQIVVSNGLLVNEQDIPNGKKMYHWSERYPICTYLVSIATYPYTIWTDTYIGLNGDTLPLEYYVYPDHYELVYDNYLLTNDMMEVFAEKFGEYPFMGEKYGHVEFGRGGGMEHQTISSMGGHSEWLIAHELGHQWWGDLVTCSSFHHIWLNEGFARFSEAIWDEASRGFEAYKSYWQNHSYFGPGTIYVEDPQTAAQIFNGNLTYNKAGWVVHMLRGVMGDSLFFESLKSYGYNDSLAYSDVTTEDFKNVCEDISGLNLSNFFEQWIYNEYYPQYGLLWDINEVGELIITIHQLQNWQYFEMPIDIKVVLNNESLFFRVNNQFQTEEYNLGFINSIPLSVQLDPDGWILKEIQYLNNDNIVPELSNILIYPAYPNPFNPEVTFKYFLPTRFGEIQSEINIYDLQGKLIDKIGTGKSKPGINNVSWKANVPSGTYFIQMNANNNIYSQKVQMVK